MNTDWYVQLVPPVDFFDGMVPVTQYLTLPTNVTVKAPWDLERVIEQAKERLEWTENAMKALEFVSGTVRWGWEGDFRHEPYVGALPWSGASHPYRPAHRSLAQMSSAITRRFGPINAWTLLGVARARAGSNRRGFFGFVGADPGPRASIWCSARCRCICCPRSYLGHSPSGNRGPPEYWRP
ncbi:hypothetical protein ACH4XT_35955 [Streptomyces avidinii]|uniref:hypothetical protein n=1 Tax=Streptomyces avidinii TaxID=1895 RepID=UPI0037A793D3